MMIDSERETASYCVALCAL